MWLICVDTRLMWENVLDTRNDYKFPLQNTNLTKVCRLLRYSAKR
jgi:hypothetical protein